jgi:hypothetical protein
VRFISKRGSAVPSATAAANQPRQLVFELETRGARAAALPYLQTLRSLERVRRAVLCNPASHPDRIECRTKLLAVHLQEEAGLAEAHDPVLSSAADCNVENPKRNRRPNTSIARSTTAPHPRRSDSAHTAAQFLDASTCALSHTLYCASSHARTIQSDRALRELFRDLGRTSHDSGQTCPGLKTHACVSPSAEGKRAMEHGMAHERKKLIDGEDRSEEPAARPARRNTGRLGKWCVMNARRNPSFDDFSRLSGRQCSASPRLGRSWAPFAS